MATGSLTCYSFTHSPRSVPKRHQLHQRASPKQQRAVRGGGEKRMSDDPAVVQAEFLAKDVVEYLLNKEGMSVNGYTDVLPGHLRKVPRKERQCLHEPSFEQARRQIVCGCQCIMHQHGVEIEQICMKVDVGDEHLYSNVKEALATIWEEPKNWGRLVSLFVAAYYLCKRICDEEGEGSEKIDSVIGWLASFLKENAVPWVVERGGFAGVLYGTNIKPQAAGAAVEDCKSDYTKASLFVTALGLGAAVVVGTIIGR
uniref:BHP1 protein n=1 Tax=Geodia cydonium TaxID=6047 RepID=Q9N9X1_GEOCY|nr:BHP1 protein [Geodia cydonium]CAC80487.1 BHP1g protein [Geodia cydonium]